MNSLALLHQMVSPTVPLPGGAMGIPASTSLVQRFEGPNLANMQSLLRGELSGQAAVDAQLSLERAITMQTANLPIRENLEAEAKIIVPLDTPLRNRIKRKPGAGAAAIWKLITSLGQAFATAGDQPGGNPDGAAQFFFAETSAPANLSTKYATRSAAYKLSGQIRQVSEFANAAGRSFGDLYAVEKTNAILAVMLDEENALTNSTISTTALPFGDGTTAYGYDGLLAQVSTANGTPADHVQTAVGPFTIDHFDAQLTRIWKKGGRKMWVLMSAQEQQSLKKVTIGTNSGHRVVITSQTDTTLGVRVSSYIHPISGEVVDILTSRFVPSGTMIFGCDGLPDGSPSLEVEVLEVVKSAHDMGADPNGIQGYAAQDIPAAIGSPLLLGFIVFLFSVLKMKAATVFAKSTGVTPAV